MKRLLYDKDGRVHAGSSMLLMLVVVLIISPVVVSALLLGIVGVNNAGVLLDPFNSIQGRLLLTVSYAVNITLILLLWRLIYKKPFDYLGVGLKDGIAQTLSELFFGLLLGFVVFSAVYLLTFLLGGVKVLGFDASRLLSADTLSFFVVFVFVGIYEELLGRGYVIYALGEGYSKNSAIVISSVFFAVLHLGNNGVTVISVLNLFLVGVLFALMFIKTGRLWVAIGFHIIWNFAQGSIYGINVSGISTNNSVFSSEPSGSAIVNGGAFGSEGGIVVTFVILTGIAYFYLKRDNFHLFRNNTTTHYDK